MKAGRIVVGPFELLILLAGLPLLPLYYYTSSPKFELNRLQQNLDNLHITLPVYVTFADQGFRFPDLIEAAQIQLNLALSEHVTKFHYQLVDKLTDPELPVVEQEFGNKYVLELLISNDNSVLVHQEQSKATVLYSLSAIHANDLPFFMVQALMDHLLYADLYEYNLEDYNSTMDIELIQVIKDGSKPNWSDTLSQLLPQACQNFLSDIGNNFINYQVQYSSVSETQIQFRENAFYFELVDEVNSSSYDPLSSVYKLLIDDTFDTTNHTVLEVNPLFDEILYSLPDKLRLAPHPSGNIDLRLGAIIKHLVLKNVYQILESCYHVEKSVQLRVISKLKEVMGELGDTDWKALFIETNSLLQEVKK